MNQKLLISATAILIGIFLQNCASVGRPSGGPKDEAAPKIIKSTPVNRSVNFTENRIVVEFDEYIKLDKIHEKFVVSPPMEKEPEVTVKGKKLLIKSEEAFKDSTTYTLKFSDAIQDYNEGNPIENYEFVFATGATIDSLRLFGTVVNAFTQEPAEAFLVMVYKNHTDSAPYLQLPDYLAKTDEQGRYNITNIAAADYRIFALADANNNRLFDMREEAIAFSKEIFTPKVALKQVRDTVRLDSVLVDNIYEYIDTVFTYKKQLFLPDSIRLFSFTEETSYLELSEFERSEKGRLSFVFSQNLSERETLEPLDFNINKNSYFQEWSASRDSLTVWFADSLIYNRDTLSYTFGYFDTDTLGHEFAITDTIILIKPKEKEIAGRARRKQQEAKTKLAVSFQVGRGAKLDILSIPSVSFQRPVSIKDPSNFELAHLHDSTQTVLEYKLEEMGSSSRKFKIIAHYEPGERYSISIDSAMVTDVYGNANDSTGVGFSVQPEDYYGILQLNLNGVEQTTLVQLLSKKSMVREFTIEKDEKLTIEHLPAGEYELRAIYDTNKNGLWDTGIYLEHSQPETVKFMDGKAKIRANWDTEIDWDLSE